MRRQIGQRIHLRRTPEVRLLYDSAAEDLQELEDVIAQIHRQKRIDARERRELALDGDSNAEADSDDEGFLKFGSDSSDDDEDDEDPWTKDWTYVNGKPNPFMIGVGDPEYDSEAEDDIDTIANRPTLDLNLSLIPDSFQEIDEFEITERERQWKEAQRIKRKQKRRR